jgi:hypothetical protein
VRYGVKLATAVCLVEYAVEAEDKHSGKHESCS